VRSLKPARIVQITTIQYLFALFLVAYNSVAWPQSVKIAFTGDQGVGENARSVLQLIASEGTDLLMIQGDLGYDLNAASQWEANLNDTLGPNFPVVIVAGNHENFEWPLYQSLTRQRIDRAGGLSCNGDVGVKSTCQFANIDIVQVAPGIDEIGGVSGDDNYADFIRSSFAGDSGRWRICSWHKNQNALQTGDKGDSTGWDVYDACLDAGAMVVVAHEHAYARTFLLNDFENQTVVHTDTDMTLQSGQSFVAVSGLGGRDPRPQQRGGDWWASIYTTSQGGTHGAMFCEFDSDIAECYFKAIDGSVPDQFTLHLGAQSSSSSVVQASPVIAAVQPTSIQNTGYVFARTDKEAYRWIDRTQSGSIGNIWIDRACAEQLGGASVSGDWGDLIERAPEIDSIANPCTNSDSASQGQVPLQDQGMTLGYVFSRSDKEEYWWINRNDDGVIGSAWIDLACAERLGGSAVSGDWGDLLDTVSAIGSIADPCLQSDEADLALNSPVSSGYVFSRTDKEEFRWIDRDEAGELGNIWIDRDCADSLGGASVSGEWKELNALAPRFDAIPNPCN